MLNMLHSVSIISHGICIIKDCNEEIVAKGRRKRPKGQFRDNRLVKKKPGSIANILKIILPYKETRIVLFVKTNTFSFNWKRKKEQKIKLTNKTS